MQEAAWQDEIATISLHASRGVIDPFLNYVSPNSHIGFTALLAAWMQLFPDGLDVYTLRLLPLSLFLAAIPVTYAAAYRLGGPLCAAASALAFAGSAVSENFATQLRGYGPSWMFFSAALWCALEVRRHPGWGAGYFLACLGAIAILPTNLYFLLVLALAVIIANQLEAEPKAPRVRCALILLGSPLLCLPLAYAGVWPELMAFARIDFSEWTRGALIQEWLRGSLSSVVLLTPLIGAGLAFALAQTFSTSRAKPRDRVGPACAALLCIGFVLSLAVMPSPPFPRTLVPYLPVWLSAACLLALGGLRGLAHRSGWAVGGAGAALLSAAVLFTPVALPCRDAPMPPGKFHYDLCRQYFRDGYDPSAVLDVWATQSEPLQIISDFEGYRALQFLGSPAQVFEFRNFSGQLEPRPLIVAHDRAEMEKMAIHVGLAPGDYVLASDTGYFQVYRAATLR